jgi:IS30 family transposase
LASKARVAFKMVQGNALWTRVIDALRGGLSPEQASGMLQRMPDAVRISHETIYTALYVMPRNKLCRQILELLPRGHKSRRPRSAGTDRCGLMPRATSIDERPVDINERLVPGHWEGDPTQGGEKPVADRNPGRAQDLVHRLGGAGQRHG